MADIGLVDADSPVLTQIDAAATRYGVDPNLAHTVAQMESGYNPNAVSPAGAQGVMQLMPGTAQQYGVANPFDSAQNIDGGVRMLRDLSRQYGADNVPFILAGYNAGPGAVKKYGGVPPFKETQNYVAKGMKILGSAPKTAPAAPDIGLEDAEPADPETLTLEGATIKAPPTLESLGLNAPPTEPPGTPAPPEEKTALGFINNLGTSAYNNIVSPIVHPGQTLAGISNLLEGMYEKGGGKPVPGMQGRQAIEGLTNLYTQRYGSWQGFKDAWYKDPVGMVGDLAIAADGLGLGKAAVQDFIAASGLKDAALAARDTLAGAVPDTGKTGAAAAAAVKAVPGAAMGAAKKAFDPALILSGPHAMVIGAKMEFAKQVAKAAKEAWKGAGEAPEAAETAAEAAPAAAMPAPAAAASAGPTVPPLPGYNISQRSTYGFRPDLAAEMPTTAPPPGTWDYSPQTGTYTFRPQAPPTAPPSGLSFDDLARALTNGKDPSKLTDAERATVQTTYDRINNPPAEAPPSARVLSREEAARLFPDAFPETPVAPPATEPIPAPPSPPMAPEPPAPAAATPPMPEAPTGPLAAKPKAAEIARQLEETTRTSRITEFLKANWGELTPADIDKFDAHDWELIGKGAGGAAPTPEQIGEIRASVASAAAPVPPEVNKMPPAQAEAAVAPKLRKPPASAAPVQKPAAPPPAEPRSLAEMMAGIPERPEPEKLDFAQVTRARNVERLYQIMTEAGITPEMVDAEGDAGWAALAKKAKIGPKGKPYAPSETTKAQLRQRFAESRKAQ